MLEEIPDTGEVSKDHVSFCERFMELMVDMMARLPTRRWFHLILQSTHMITHSDLSTLASRREGQLYLQEKVYNFQTRPIFNRTHKEKSELSF